MSSSAFNCVARHGCGNSAEALLQRSAGVSDSDDGMDLAAVGRDLTQPAIVVAVVVLGFLLVSTRELWGNGFPVARFSLPLPASGWDTVAAYAGGWNPAGFGSIEQLPPFLALAGDRPGGCARRSGSRRCCSDPGRLRLRGCRVSCVSAEVSGSICCLPLPAGLFSSPVRPRGPSATRERYPRSSALAFSRGRSATWSLHGLRPADAASAVWPVSSSRSASWK